MSIVTDSVLKTYFETGDKPTQQQFANLIDSKAHVSDMFNVGNTGIQNGTAGRIFYQDASNKFAQNSNLYFDETNFRLSIAVGNSPTARVETKSPGNLSTDIAGWFKDFSNNNILKARGDKYIEIGSGQNSGFLFTGHGGTFGSDETAIYSGYDGNLFLLLAAREKLILRSGIDATGEAELFLFKAGIAETEPVAAFNNSRVRSLVTFNVADYAFISQVGIGGNFNDFILSHSGAHRNILTIGSGSEISDPTAGTGRSKLFSRDWNGAGTNSFHSLNEEGDIIRIVAMPGWGTPTGTLTRTTFASYAGQDISAIPTEGEVQAIDDHVKILSERLAAVISDLKLGQQLFKA